MTQFSPEGGPVSGSLASEMRESILTGEIAPGDFLPSVRQLSKKKHLAPKTVHRALISLAADGLVTAETGRGFRVLASANDPNRGCPVAFLLSALRVGDAWTGLSRIMLNALQAAAGRRGWSVLGTPSMGVSPATVIEQCKVARAWGAVVDVHGEHMERMARESGLAVVMVDAWHPDSKSDAIIQDGLRGGQQAADYLTTKGHARIAWVGPRDRSIHSDSRFAGALTALRASGKGLAERNIIQADREGESRAARQLLKRKDRPTAVIALWRDTALSVAEAARELGLKLGKDLDLVGWCSEEQYKEDFAAHFDGHVPPAIVYSMATMAETAIERLSQRRHNANLPPLRINIETRLKIHGEK